MWNVRYIKILISNSAIQFKESLTFNFLTFSEDHHLKMKLLRPYTRIAFRQYKPHHNNKASL